MRGAQHYIINTVLKKMSTVLRAKYAFLMIKLYFAQVAFKTNRCVVY